MEFELHEFCSLFPQGDDKTLNELADDIKENGLNELIVKFEAKILDGRNRLMACRMAGVEPDFVEFKGDRDAALAYVISRNIHRRHLSPSQLSACAHEAYKLSGKTIPLEELQDQFNISGATFARAVRIDGVASEKVKAKIIKGDLSVSKAVKALKQAQEATGIKVTKTSSEEDKKIVQEVQEKILDNLPDDDEPATDELPVKNRHAETFNEKVLGGVYDGTRFRKNMAKMQEIMKGMDTLTDTMRDSVELVGLLDQETRLNMLVGLAGEISERAADDAEALRPSEISNSVIIKAIKELMNAKLEPLMSEIEQSGEAINVEIIQKKFVATCRSIAKECSVIHKKLSHRKLPRQDSTSSTEQ